MKPEPLKGKREEHPFDYEVFYFCERDVHSAVEWLKYKLRYYNNKEGIYQIIDEAFADVMGGGE